MALNPALVKTYSCAGQGETDASAVGGAEDTTTAIGFDTDPTGNKYDIRFSGTGASTLNTIRYRDQAGIIQSATANNSTTAATWVQFVMGTGYRLLSWILTSPSSGTYDLGYDTGLPSASTVIASMDQNAFPAFKMRRLFINAIASDLVTKTFYDKTFWHNHNVGTLLSPTYRITADPGVMIRQGIAATLNDTATVQRAGGGTPAGITFVDDNIDQVGADLPSGSGQGIWWEMAAAIANPAKNTSFTSQVTFSGT
jgi:hypothetical protein